jgi:hypothetical protein
MYSPKICKWLEKGKNLLKRIIPQTPPPEPQRLIEYFEIEKHETVLFENKLDREMINRAFQKIQNISELEKLLEDPSNQNDDAKILKIHLNKYREEIDLVKSKIVPGKIDTDEISTVYSEKLADLLEKRFLNKIIDSIYRGQNAGKYDAMYRELLVLTNKYLHSIGVYTMPAHSFIEGEKLADEKLSFIDLRTSKTMQAEEDELIKTVERLPYFLNYFDANNRADTLIIKGYLIIHRYIEEQ